MNEQAPEPRTFDVSSKTLEKLRMGLDGLRQRHTQLAQELERTQALILRQEGAVELMEELLQPAGSAAVTYDEPPVAVEEVAE